MPYLEGAKFFASLDLIRGFWQFPIAEESRRFWSFITHHGQFEFSRVVMGGKNSAGYFKKTMQKVLETLLFICVLIYIDDVLVFAKTEDAFVQALGNVFEQLRVHNIFLKPQKCTLFAARLIWCGHVIDATGIAINPTFAARILDLPRPSNAAELPQFIASCNWIRGKLPRYAKLIEPLQTLLTAAMSKAKSKKSRAVARVPLSEWADMHEEAFANIKQAIAEAVKLTHPQADYVMCYRCVIRPLVGHVDSGATRPIPC